MKSWRWGWLGAGVAGALATSSALALRVEGHVYDDTAVVADAPLRLNGAGVRSQLWFKAFTAGLYLPQPVTQASGVLSQTGAKRLRVRMLVEVHAREFSKALLRGVEKNYTAEDRAPLAQRLTRLAELVQSLGTLRDGDAVDLDFKPGTGLVLSLNGSVRGEPIPGEDIYRALLRIFIGEQPAQAALKNALLGLPAR